LIAGLTLKDMNLISQPIDKEFKRKNQAIEYMMTLVDLPERLGSFFPLESNLNFNHFQISIQILKLKLSLDHGNTT
jgi:hypothetical protein